MSFINKVKNFFYEDIEEEVDDVKEEPKKKFNPFKKEPKVEEVKPIEEEVKDVKQEANNDLSERELFRAERTFNFPMDLGDEIFDDEDTKVIKKEEPVYVKKEEPKETYTRSIYHNISREEPKREEKKKFKPSPVISPVYGILDKNYTVDDVVDADKTKEFSFDKKIVDFDSVRNRAYRELDEELEKTQNTDIFYNLDEEVKEEPVIETPVVEETPEDDFNVEEPSVIISYEDMEASEPEYTEPEIVPVEKVLEEKEDEDDDISPDVKIEPKKKRSSRAAKKEEPEVKEKEDLFNLIDNMYSEDEEEDDE